MTQAARGSGRRRQHDRDQQQTGSRDTDTHPTRQSTNFYEPLPLGSDAFMPPLAPAAEPRTSALRKVAVWCALGTLAGASAGGIVLAFVLERESAPSTALARVAVAEPQARAKARQKQPEHEPVRVVASLPAAKPAIAERSEEQARAAAVAPPSPERPDGAGDEAKAAQVGAQASTDDGAAAVNGATRTGAETRRASSSQRDEPLIDKPTRAQVLAAMARVQPAVKACLEHGRGMVTADLTIVGRTGRVTNAQVSGQVGSVGSCVARAVRKAKFPKFTAESISVRYPMVF